MLAEEVAALRDPGIGDFCANDLWYAYSRRGEGFKARMSQVVGWGAVGADPASRSRVAYEVAYSRLYDLLPPCRHEVQCGLTATTTSEDEDDEATVD